MDQARLFIAIVLSILVFVMWDYFVVKKQPVKQPKRTQESQQQIAKEKQAVPEKKKVVTDALPVAKETTSKLVKPSRTITVDTPLYRLKISEKGAVFKSFVLKEYRATTDKDSPLLEMISPDINDGTVRLGFTGNKIPGLEDAVFLSNFTSDHVKISEKSQEVVFSWESTSGIVVEKKFIFSPEQYLIDLHVTVKNGSHRDIQENLMLSLIMPVSTGKQVRYGFEGPSALINDKLEQIKIKKIKDKNTYTGKLKWIAVQDRYFISALMPKEPFETSMHLSLPADNLLESRYLQPANVINNGSQHVFEYKLYFGPKSMKILSELDYDLVKAINFGMFDILAKPCVWIMNFLYDHFIPNYGVAIIILTIFTKVLLWPLGNKSYKSMNEMKKIQPLMAEIREKYKDDKKKLNEETMALYKTYKVNPLGGCLPMVVQIPVFFALYRMLYEAIELRHAPFFGWITDLSAPDRLFSFDFSVPFMQAPYGIPVLTIIMGITMFLQQKMSPPMGDPTQAKMMQLMPVVFTVIFINFSSGLVLYWLVNNILSISQQYYIMKKSA